MQVMLHGKNLFTSRRPTEISSLDELFCQKGGNVMDSFFGKQFRRRNKDKDRNVS
jgi:hypothetical protein